MEMDRVHPALRDATARAPRLPLEHPLLRRAISGLSRLVPGARTEQVQRCVVRAGGRRLRVFTPEARTGAALVWVHGGGLVLGSAAMDDRFCGQTARDTGAIVVSVDYRLAPRHVFPAALDDCHAGYTWLHEHADALGVDRARIAVGGQSAGGGLAAALAQRLADEGAPMAAQWLFCPMLDDRTAADRSLDAANHFAWNNRNNLVGWSSYLGPLLGGDCLPAYAAAARRADLTGLPPSWLYASDIELFCPEITEYARRLRGAGVEVTLEVVPGAPHGFESWAGDTAPARALLATARDWLRARLAA